MTAASLLLVAHGSRDPAAAEQVYAVLARLRTLRPDLSCAAGFLERTAPAAVDALATLPRPVIVVPYLLADAHHARVDVGGLVTDGVSVAGVLGDDPRLVEVVADRLRSYPGSVVLATAGTSDPAANAVTTRFAGRLREALHRPVVAAFASAAEPTVPQAISSLPKPVVVLRWLLAPGAFSDRVAADSQEAGAACTDVIGDHPVVADLLLDRFDEARGGAR